MTVCHHFGAHPGQPDQVGAWRYSRDSSTTVTRMPGRSTTPKWNTCLPQQLPEAVDAHPAGGAYRLNASFETAILRNARLRAVSSSVCTMRALCTPGCRGPGRRRRSVPGAGIKTSASRCRRCPGREDGSWWQ
jgi:hypothetical protein